MKTRTDALRIPAPPADFVPRAPRYPSKPVRQYSDAADDLITFDCGEPTIVLAAPKPLTSAERGALLMFAGLKKSGVNGGLASVKGLQSAGLIVRDPMAWFGFAITDAGRAALAAHEAGK